GSSRAATGSSDDRHGRPLNTDWTETTRRLPFVAGSLARSVRAPRPPARGGLARRSRPRGVLGLSDESPPVLAVARPAARLSQARRLVSADDRRPQAKPRERAFALSVEKFSHRRS